MKVFFNDLRSGYEEIVNYGPRWWTQYKEMDAVYKFAGWTLDLMAYFLEKSVANQFPGVADIEGISIFEKILGIEPESESSLEERRTMVLAYYSGMEKLSKSVIQKLIKTYIGCDSDIVWEGQVFRIYLSGGQPNEKLLSILLRRMPAHISYIVSINKEILFNMYVSMSCVYYPQWTIFCEDIDLSRKEGTDGTVS